MTARRTRRLQPHLPGQRILQRLGERMNHVEVTILVAVRGVRWLCHAVSWRAWCAMLFAAFAVQVLGTAGWLDLPLFRRRFGLRCVCTSCCQLSLNQAHDILDDRGNDHKASCQVTDGRAQVEGPYYAPGVDEPCSKYRCDELSQCSQSLLHRCFLLGKGTAVQMLYSTSRLVNNK